MSRRIADTLEVLDLIRRLAQQNPNDRAKVWRQEAIAHVASRGVEKNTVFAHLVGKNTAFTLGSDEIDHLIETWVGNDSVNLKEWILKSCEKRDEHRVSLFFITEQSTPFAADISEPGVTEKHLVTTYRILRDTALARRIKADNDYKCQVCGERIMLNENKPYSEAHHVKPLGSPHNGPDHPDNIVCVCPNCHVKLDYGAIEIDQAMFPNVLSSFIYYHNEFIFKIAV